MRSPTLALIWEQWRQVRGVVVVCAFIMVLSHLILGSVTYVDLREGLETTAFVISMLFIAKALLFTGSAALALQIPQRTMVLPSSRLKLAAMIFSFRVVAFGLISFIFALLSNFDNATSIVITMLLASVMSVAVAVAWLLGSNNAMRAAAGLILIPIPLVYMATVATFYLFNNYRYLYLNFLDADAQKLSISFIMSYHILYAAPALCITLLSVVIAIRAIRPHTLVANKIGLPVFSCRSLPFLKMESHFGFELRHSFGWYPSAAFAVVLLFLLTVLPNEALYRNPAKILGEMQAELILPLSALATGLFVVIYEQRRTTIGGMLFTRPVATAALANARFRVSILSVLLVTGIWFAVAWAILPRGGPIPTLLESIWSTAAVCLFAVTLIWVPLQSMFFIAWMFTAAAIGDFFFGFSEGELSNIYELVTLLLLPCIAYSWRLYKVLHACIASGFLSYEVRNTALFCTVAALPAVCWGALSALPSEIVRVSLKDIFTVLAFCMMATVPGYALLSYTIWLDKVRHGKPLLSIHTARLLEA